MPTIDPPDLWGILRCYNSSARIFQPTPLPNLPPTHPPHSDPRRTFELERWWIWRRLRLPSRLETWSALRFGKLGVGRLPRGGFLGVGRTRLGGEQNQYLRGDLAAHDRDPQPGYRPHFKAPDGLSRVNFSSLSSLGGGVGGIGGVKGWTSPDTRLAAAKPRSKERARSQTVRSWIRFPNYPSIEFSSPVPKRNLVCPSEFWILNFVWFFFEKFFSQRQAWKLTGEILLKRNLQRNRWMCL